MSEYPTRSWAPVTVWKRTNHGALGCIPDSHREVRGHGGKEPVTFQRDDGIDEVSVPCQSLKVARAICDAAIHGLGSESPPGCLQAANQRDVRKRVKVQPRHFSA